MMALWLRFDKKRLNTITFEEFLNYMRKHSNNSRNSSVSDKPSFELSPSEIKPAEYFFATLKNEWIKLKTSSQTEFSMSSFFNMVKSKLFQKWNEQIINQSKLFKQVS